MAEAAEQISQTAEEADENLAALCTSRIALRPNSFALAGPPTAPPPGNCDCSARLEVLIRNANSFDDLKALLASGGV